MSGQEAVKKDHMTEIRSEVKQRAIQGHTVLDITYWLNSNGYTKDERYVGRLLAKTQVRRARRQRLDRYIRSLEEGTIEEGTAAE